MKAGINSTFHLTFLSLDPQLDTLNLDQHWLGTFIVQCSTGYLFICLGFHFPWFLLEDTHWTMNVSVCPRNFHNPGKMDPKKGEDPPLVRVSICNRAEVRV